MWQTSLTLHPLLLLPRVPADGHVSDNQHARGELLILWYVDLVMATVDVYVLDLPAVLLWIVSKRLFQIHNVVLLQLPEIMVIISF